MMTMMMLVTMHQNLYTKTRKCLKQTKMVKLELLYQKFNLLSSSVAVQRKERLVVESLDPADPISGLLVTGSEMVDISHRKG